jgi:hypothetical protein
VRGLFAAGLLGLIAGLWTWTLRGDPDLRAETPVARLIVLDNGFHTDLALPRAALEEGGGALAQAVRALPPGDWIIFGWGDARFYVDQSPVQDRLPDGARAFFMPGNASVLMLDPHAGEPGRGMRADRRRYVEVGPQALAALRRRLRATLDLSDGAPRLVAARPGDDARFYAARGHFWILNLCNTWAARTLNAAGFPVRPLRSVVSPEVLAAVDRAELDRPDRRD